jgi:CheY-like chemotaxis protein
MKLSGKTIFIVENEPSVRAVMLTILQMNGAKTYFEPWGAETVKRLKNAQQVDLILMDLMLSHGTSGYDVCAQIKADPALCDIPIVIVSASDPDVEMKKARLMGLQGFITKPLDYRNFPDMLLQLLEGHEVWAD